MGYFPEYENTPCWYCGRTNCTGDHPEPEARKEREKVTHFEMGFGHSSCQCYVCREMREREANRKT